MSATTSPPASVLLLGGTLVTAGDVLFLRDGSALTGDVVRVESDGYVLMIPGRAVSGSTRIPRSAVRFAIFDDSAEARKWLALDQVRSWCSSPQPLRVDFLPAEAFGEALLAAVKQARRSVHILAYFISGSRAPPISDFYQELKEKAAAGVDVTIVVEFGPGTENSIKHTTMQFTEQLMNSDIKVRYYSAGKVLHKKIVIVDGEQVFLGSSNLTGAGTRWSREMNVYIRDRTFSQATEADFRGLWQHARRASDALRR